MNSQKPPAIPAHVRAQNPDLFALNVSIVAERIDELAMEIDKESGELLKLDNEAHKRKLSLMRLQLYSMQIEHMSQLMQKLLEE